MVIQPRFGNGWHDILQYHVFCEDRYYAARVFWTETLWHHSAWVYDGGARELWNSDLPLEQSDTEYVDLKGSNFTMCVPDGVGTVKVEPGDTNDALEIRVRARNSFQWYFPFGGPPTIHQPNLECEVHYQGQVHRGLGYSKRYHFEERVAHWGYRFVHATVDDHSWALWSADATFAHKKYAYFKVVGGNGDLHEANLKDSSHRDDAIYGVIDGAGYEVELEEVGAWETLLRSPSMDSQMRQRFCRATINHHGRSEAGYAVNETCFGTLV